MKIILSSLIVCCLIGSLFVAMGIEDLNHLLIIVIIDMVLGLSLCALAIARDPNGRRTDI